MRRLGPGSGRLEVHFERQLVVATGTNRRQGSRELNTLAAPRLDHYRRLTGKDRHAVFQHAPTQDLIIGTAKEKLTAYSHR